MKMKTIEQLYIMYRALTKVILKASSNCCMVRLITAEASRRMMSGFLNCSRYFTSRLSAGFTFSSL